MKALSLDLRERVVESYDSGFTKEEVASQFSISVSSIKRWLRKRKGTGDLSPGVPPGRPFVLDSVAAELLHGWLQENNDLTLKELRQLFIGSGYHVGTTAVFDLLRREGISRKKNDARY